MDAPPGALLRPEAFLPQRKASAPPHFLGPKVLDGLLDNELGAPSDFEQYPMYVAKSTILTVGRVAALLWLVLPVKAQYAGPAILARGEAPAAMTTPAIDFRPFLEVTGIYNTGLAGVAVTNQGTLATSASPGVGLAWGISGTKSWRHTKVGLDYRGDIEHYTHETRYDSTNQEILFGLTQALSRHILLTFRSSAGTYSLNFGLRGLTQTVPFDPNSTYVPQTDFFDNRTMYATGQLDLTVQKSARLSFNFGGDGSVVSRRGQDLAGAVSAGARGDMQYRLTRRSTIGALYFYQHYDFTRVLGGTDIHSVNGTYSIRLSRWLEFTGYGGFVRVESKLIQQVAVDPVIAAILGITTAAQIFHNISVEPNFNGRLSRTFRTGVAYISGGHAYVPGNGLFLTSSLTSVQAGYGYTGLRRWSFNAAGLYDRADAQANVSGQYGDYGMSLSASHTLRRGFNLVSRYYLRKYYSGDFSNYNRWVNDVRVGFGFTPGDVPLRIW